jgi:hypothetical protein
MGHLIPFITPVLQYISAFMDLPEQRQGRPVPNWICELHVRRKYYRKMKKEEIEGLRGTHEQRFKGRKGLGSPWTKEGTIGRVSQEIWREEHTCVLRNIKEVAFPLECPIGGQVCLLSGTKTVHSPSRYRVPCVL